MIIFSNLTVKLTKMKQDYTLKQIGEQKLLHHILDDATDGYLECPGETRGLMNGCLKRLAQVLCYETTLEAESCDIWGI